MTVYRAAFYGLENWWSVLGAGIVISIVVYVVWAAIKRHLP